MSIIFRAATSADTQALADLSRDTFVDTFAHLYADEDLSSFVQASYAPDVIASEIGDSNLLHHLAELDGELIGYCKIGFVQTLDYDAGDNKIVELKQLYVRADHHGAGIAQSLTDWAIDKARSSGADAMLLSVYSDNPRAQHFYQKYGFEKVADTFFMVGNHRDEEYLFIKLLK